MRPQIVNKISVLSAHLLVSGWAMAQDPPPPESTPPPVGLPIDENLLILGIAGFILGTVFLLIKKSKATN